jgi:uncharacterized protein YdcH (DUF465 family)
MVSIESLERHRDTLVEKHKELDKQIKVLYKQYTPDDVVNEMKQEKLKLKQEIVNINNTIGDSGNG